MAAAFALGEGFYAAYALGNLQHALTFGVIDIGTVIIHPFV